MLVPWDGLHLVDKVLVLPINDEEQEDATFVRADDDDEGEEFDCAVQPAVQTGMLAELDRKMEEYRDQGIAVYNVLFSERPSIAGPNRTISWFQHGSDRIPPKQIYDPPIRLISLAGEVPPSGGGSRWTVTAKQASY